MRQRLLANPQFRNRAATWGPIALSALAASLVAYLVCKDGIPQLRQDWAFSPLPDALGPSIGNLFEPWLQSGIGEPQANPTAYLIGLILRPFCFLPPYVFVALLLFGDAFLVAAGGAALARSVTKGKLAAAACSIFALFNPWVYTEVVAGHVWMVMAYGLLLLLAAEVCSDRPRLVCLTIFCGLLICQIEFFLIAVVPLSLWLLRKRLYLPLIALFVAAVPIAFGIASNYRGLLGTPYLLAWQKSQSVAPWFAATLRGYFTHYASSFAGVSAALWVVALLGLFAVFIAIQMRMWTVLSILMLGFIAAAASTGTKWVLAPAYAAAVLHVLETGVFRELYDLLAFLAIAYVLAVAVVCSKVRWLGAVATAAALCLLLPWLATLPATWFVPASALHPLRFPADAESRVALFPASQPLQLGDGRGSGYDPDLFVQRDRASPINSFVPQYPQSRALALAQQGDTVELSALGVRYLYARKELREDDGALRAQGRAPHGGRTTPRRAVLPGRFPILGLIDGRPQVSTIAASVAEDAIFFGDVPMENDTWYAVIAGPRSSDDPQKGWTDARLAYDRYPFAATRFGGAFTSTNKQSLTIPNAPALLAWTSARLVNAAGKIIATRSRRIRWWPLPRDSTKLSCYGACIVSAVGRPPSSQEGGPLRMPQAVRYSTITPWLISADVPTHRVATLRWAVRYERSWMLFGLSAEHVRLAEALNAWVLRAGPATRVYLVDVIAMVQLLLEVLAAIAILVLAGMAWRNENRLSQGALDVARYKT